MMKDGSEELHLLMIICRLFLKDPDHQHFIPYKETYQKFKAVKAREKKFSKNKATDA